MLNGAYFFVPLLIWGSHYVGTLLDIRSRRYVEIIQSLAAGLAVGYVFLYLIPDVTKHGYDTNTEMMSVALLGFVFFHTALKFVFKTTDEKRKHFLADEIHLSAVALYNFVITFTLIELIKIDMTEGLLLLFLITVHTSLSELSHHQMKKDQNQGMKVPLIFGATLLGAIAPVFGLVDELTRALIYSFAAGAIIYISIREEIPEGSSGNPVVFIIGTIFILAIFTLVSMSGTI